MCVALIAAVTAKAAPVILAEPQKAVVTVGSNHLFSVTATGNEPLGYQWLFQGAAISGANARDFLLTNAQTNNAGPYQVVVSDASGSVTSSVARLVVRMPGEPLFSVPQGGWAYIYGGDTAGNAGASALDGKWNHDNGSDSWSGDGRGPGGGLPGGVTSANGVLTIEDAVVSGSSSVDNRRYYFTHNLQQELSASAADFILNNGVTLNFRARLTPAPPGDPLTELTNAPNGFVNVLDGKGMFGIRQAGANGMLVSFSLGLGTEDTSATAAFNFGQAGLHMNNLNGDLRSPQVDPGDGGVINVFPIDPAVFHDFWITIIDNGGAPGTHRVSIYVDGNTNPVVFNVTAGSGLDAPFTNYIAMGLPSTGQRGAFDVDFFAYKAGASIPAGLADPVQIVTQPKNQLGAEGEPATFSVEVTGASPFGYQWYRNGVAISGATNATHTTPPVVPSDNGAQFVVVVTNLFGIATSAPPATLNFVTAPTIVAEPADVTVTNGSPASFSVGATSIAEVYYQWRFNGGVLQDQTNSTLAIANANPSHAGGYDVIVSNSSGSSTSRVATLTVRTLDYGDAPVTYATLAINGGASHVLVNGLHLGAAIDFELDGAPDSAAQGDDVSGDDEDGVVFTSPLRAGAAATIEVAASAPGVLNAWIDFNRDGDWFDSGEQIFADRALAVGANALSFPVPPGVTPGTSFARFRFGTTSGLSPIGPAADGEVEDYQVSISPVTDLGVTISDAPDPVAAGSNLVYSVNVVNGGPSGATGVTLVDTLPPGATFVSAVPSIGTCAPISGGVQCNLGNLSASGTATVTITVRAAAGLQTNVVNVAANEQDPNPANNTAAVVTSVELPPAIVTPPASLVVTQGNPAVFSVTASGTPPLGYQWRFQGSVLPGQTAPTLSMANVQPTNAGAYSVSVSNRVGQTQSAAATLTVLEPPVISQHPAGQTDAAGNTVVMTVVATGTAPLGYQWRFNGNAISGATSPTFTLVNAQKTNSGNYTVVVTNPAGAVTSLVAVVTITELDFGDAPDGPYPTLRASNGARHVLQAGVFLGASVDFESNGQAGSNAVGDDSNGSPDEDGIVFRDALFAGQPVRVDVIASTNGFLNGWFDFAGNGAWSDVGDQIFTNTSLVRGTNSLVFRIPAAPTTAATFARFRFSTASGLGIVGEAPDGEVEDYSARVGQAVQLSLSMAASSAVVAVGSNITYQINVTNHGPSTASNVLVTDVLPPSLTFVSAVASGGSCTNNGNAIGCGLESLAPSGRVTVTIVGRANSDGTVTNTASVGSADHDLFAGDNVATAISEAYFYPAIVQAPASQTVTNGTTVTLGVVASGTGLRYQWAFNGTNLVGATNPNYVIADVQSANSGTYVVTVSNAVGQVTSGPAQLTVLVRPAILLQPQSQTVIAGATINLSVTASGTQPLSYQWFRNDVALAGQTAATLVLPNAQPSNDGAYHVLVSNEAGGVQSATATVTVLVPPQIVTQPQSATNLASRTAVLTASATGTEPLSYQWVFNGTTRIPGANQPSLIIPNAQSSDSGNYQLIVTNVAGSATSQVARLTISPADFGDAPDLGYPTLLSFNGARHFILPGIYLGGQADFEGDGLPDASALGDDLGGAADEDGVLFPERWLVGQTSSVRVIASTNGFISGWVDFNQNGTWSDPGERILASVAASAGTNVFPIVVPASALHGQTFARFRFATAPVPMPDGLAADGEVEDYALTIDPAVDVAIAALDEPDPVLASNPLTYTLTVTNRGPSTATALTVQDTLTGVASVVNVVSSQGSCTNYGATVMCELGALPAGQACTVFITIVPSQAGLLTNRATVSSFELDVNTANNVATVLSTVVEPTTSFANRATIQIPDNAAATTYPSPIFVSGVTATVEKVIVTLRNLSHVAPSDLDVLLVGPAGQRVLLMSDAGGRPGVSDVTVTFDDAATLSLPSSGSFATETYRPTNFGTNDLLPAPAPPPPYANQLAAFRGTDPNGTWSLYVVDDNSLESGVLAGGWAITFLTLERFGDLGIAQTAEPAPVAVGSNLTFLVTVTNSGPADLTGVRVTNMLPATVTLVSFTSTAGQCANNQGVVECFLGNLRNGESTTVALNVIPGVAGTITNHASAAANELDFTLANNTSRREAVVKRVNDLALSVSAAPEPMLRGQPLTYTLVVSNRGPNAATDVILRHELPPSMEFVSATTTQGAFSNHGGVVVCTLGSIQSGGSVRATIVANALQFSLVTSRTVVTSYEIELTPSDNERLVTSTIGELPRFTLQPQSLFVPVFSNANFAVSLAGTPPIRLQWFFEGSPIPGATSADLSLPSVHPVNAGLYSVMASNEVGAVTSSVARLQIDYAGYRQVTIPLIGSRDRWRYHDQGLDFGSAWRSRLFNDTSWSEGEPLFGVEMSTVYPDVIRTPLPLTTSEEEFIITYYFRRGFNFQKDGLVLSLISSNLLDDGAAFYLNGTNVGNVRLPPPPISYSTLADSVASEGEFDVVQFPPGSLLDGTNVMAVEVHQSNPGSSDIVFGSTLSAITVPIADLKVSYRAAPSPVAVGSNLVLSAVISNAGPAIATELQVRQTWTGAAVFANAIASAGSCVVDGTAVNCIIPSLAVGETAQITVAIVPNAAGPLAMTLSARAAELDLQVADNAASAAALVKDPPRILIAPASQIVTNGDSVLLSAAISGAEPIFLQWLREGIPLPNATNSTLSITSAEVRDAGSYRVLATNDVGSALSDPVVVQVLARPTISPIANQVIDEDGAVGPLPFTIGDIETPASQLQLIVTSSNPSLAPESNITIGGIDANRTIRIVPAAHQSGVALITLSVRDTDGLVAATAFQLQVNPSNDLPTITAVPSSSIVEDSVLSVNVTVGDVETAVGALTVAGASSDQSLVPNANVVVSGTEALRTVTITPLGNRFGTSVITLTVTDGDGASAVSSFILSVAPANDAPEITALADRSTDEDIAIAIPFTVSDAETTPEMLLVGVSSSNSALLPSESIIIEGSGNTRLLRLVPAQDQSGTAIITLTVDDSGASNNLTTVAFTLTVNSVNDLPLVSDISSQEISEDTGTATLPFTVGDVETPAEQLTLSAASSNPDLIAVSNVIFDGTGSNRTVTILPVTNGFGSAIVSLTVTDANGGTGTDSFVVTVSPINDGPTIETIPDQLTEEDNPAIVAMDVRDPDAQALSFAFGSLNPDLVPTNNIRAVNTGSNWVLLLVPLTNAWGSAIIDVVVSDPEGLSASATFELTVFAANDPPVIADVADQTTSEDVLISIPFTVSDDLIAASDLNVSAVSSDIELLPPTSFFVTSGGTNRLLQVRPALNRSGVATVTLTVDDGQYATADSFVVTVTPVNDPPAIGAIDDIVMDEDTAVGPITFTLSDLEASSDTLTVLLDSSNPSLLPTSKIVLAGTPANPALILTPEPDQTGSAVVSIIARDPEGATATRSFVVTFSDVNDPPVIGEIPDQSTGEDTVAVLTLPVADPESAPESVVVTAQSSNPGLLPDSALTLSFSGTNRILRMVPTTNQFGAATITVTATDTNGASSSRSFVLNVVSVNDSPQISAVPDQFTDEETPVSFGITVSDLESAPGSLNLTASSSNVSLVPPSNISFSGSGSSRTVSIAPAPNQSGIVDISLMVHDPDGGTGAFVVRLTVVESNDLPTISAVADVTADEDTSIAPIGFVIGDVETPSGNLIVIAESSNPNLLPSANIVLSGSGSNRTVVLSPAANQSGSSSIKLTVYDAQGGSATTQFTLSINPVNDLPSISAIPNQAVPQNGSLSIPIAIADAETAPADIVLSVNSSDSAIVGSGNIAWAGVPENRILRITPTGGATGSVTVTVTATDSGNASASRSFLLTISQNVDSPSIVAQPQSQIVSNGVSVAFSVTAAGSSPLQYQWRFNGVNLPGATNSTFTISSAQPSNAGEYSVLVSNAGGSLLSSSATLIVNTTPLPPVVTLISTGAVWKYLDTGTNLGTAWRSLSFDDTAWASGPGELGYGDGDEATLVGFGTNASARYITTYFRHSFLVDDPSPFTNLVIRLRRDDGAVVYLNDVELFRNNMPTGTVTFSTPASVAIGGADETNFVTNAISPASLLPGANVLAVEIHQSSGTSSDISFDLHLVGNTRPAPPGPLEIADQFTPEDTLLAVPFAVRLPQADSFILTASSTNQSLIANTNLSVTGTGTNRTLLISPNTNQFGAALIVVTASNALLTLQETFLLTVAPVNDQPTLDPLVNLPLASGAGPQSIILTGISSGAANETQTLTITASPSSTGIFNVNPAVSYTNGNSTAVLNFTPSNSSGTSMVTVAVNDGGATNNLITRSFTVYKRANSGSPPTISSIPDTTIVEDTASAPIPFTIGDAQTAAGSLVLFAVSSNPRLVPTNGMVFGGSASNRNLTLTPATNQSGVATITISVRDGNNGLTNRSFVLTVNAVNDPPSLSAINDQTIAEDGMLLVPFTVSDVETHPSLVTLSVTSSNPTLLPEQNISFSGPGGGRTLVAAPAQNEFGSSTVTLTATDAGGAVATRVFLVTVNPQNDAPTITAIADQTIPQNSIINDLPFTIGDAETPPDGLVVLATSSDSSLLPPQNIVLTGTNGLRSISLQPAPNQSGSTLVSITVRDPEGLVTSESFTLFVAAESRPPTLDPIPDLLLRQGMPPHSVPLTGISASPGGGTLTIAVSAVSDAPALLPHPAVIYSSPASSGSLVLAPNPNTSGTAVVTVSVNDGQSIVAQSFRVTVDGAPSISPIADQWVNEDVATSPLSFTVSDPEGPVSSLALAATSSNPALVPSANIVISGDDSNRVVVVTPVSNESGIATITISVTDTNGGSASESFVLVVNSANDPPTLASLADVTLQEGATDLQNVPLSGITSGAPNEIQDLAVNVTTDSPSFFASLSVQYASPATTGLLTFQPSATAGGVANVTVVVSDRQRDNSLFSRSFAVIIPSTPPTISELADAVILEDTPLGPVPFTVGDAETPVDNLLLSASSSNPDLLDATNIFFSGAGAARAFTLWPATDAYGTSVITIVVGDARGGTASRSFTLSVLPTNDAPSISPIADRSIDEDDWTGAIPFTLSDPDTPAEDLAVWFTSSNTEVIQRFVFFDGTGSNRTVTIYPHPHRNGSSLITIWARDPDGALGSQSFMLTVNPRPDAPILADIPDQFMDEDGTLFLPFGVTEWDDAISSLTISATSSNALLVANTDLSIVSGGNPILFLRPRPNQFGQSVITLIAVDTTGLSATNSFLLTVAPVNDPPAISAIPDQVMAINTTSVLPFVVFDIDNPVASLSVEAQTSNPALIGVGNIAFSGTGSNRTVTLTPVTGQFGCAQITLAVTDGSTVVTTSFEVIVNQTSGPPVIAVQPASQTIYAGSALRLRVVATGPGPLAYQWRRDGVDLAGYTNSILLLSHPRPTDSGDYTVRVSNAEGSTLSDIARIRVVVLPALTISRAGGTVTISFPTSIGQSYVLEYRDSFFDSWTQRGSSVAGTGEAITFSESIQQGSARFYRVRTE